MLAVVQQRMVLFNVFYLLLLLEIRGAAAGDVAVVAAAAAVVVELLFAAEMTPLVDAGGAAAGRDAAAADAVAAAQQTIGAGVRMVVILLRSDGRSATTMDVRCGGKRGWVVGGCVDGCCAAGGVAQADRRHVQSGTMVEPWVCTVRRTGAVHVGGV